jgi:hypothetical protein
MLNLSLFVLSMKDGTPNIKNRKVNTCVKLRRYVGVEIGRTQRVINVFIVPSEIPRGSIYKVVKGLVIMSKPPLIVPPNMLSIKSHGLLHSFIIYNYFRDEPIWNQHMSCPAAPRDAFGFRSPDIETPSVSLPLWRPQ